ncbi:hypothetical protein C8R44DRAFT_803027 [Mycena epipterygia]|nr:hypothetical protein C8R44DRAFT_803027 [Mycena epipterygia]
MPSPYPVLNLPVEIVDEIFIRCLPSLPTPDGRSWTWTSPPDKNQVPLALSSICSAWRTIALSLPSLWTSLNMDVKPVPSVTEVSRNRVAQCETWLSRSRDQPLHLCLRYAYPDSSGSEDSSQNEDALLDALNGCSSRWKSLRISLQLDDFSRLCRQLEGRVQILDTLCVDIVDGGRSTSGWIETFRNSPALQNLSVITPGWLLFLPEHLPVSQLTRLDVTRFVVAWSMLHAGIQECSISLKSESEHEIWPANHMLLHGQNHGRYLSHLTLPAVETLELAIAPDDIAHFLAVITRSSCVLRNFHVVLQQISTDAFLSCLVATPSVAELTIDVRSCDDITPHGLTTILLGRQLLPHLTALRIRVNHLQGIVYPVLAEMLASRSNDSGFQHFRIDADGGPAPDLGAIQSLKALVSLGMSIKLCVDVYRWV